jgi:3-oxoacyl-[acyl-carrier protein] reductase
MRVTLDNVPRTLDAALAEAFRAAGHELGGDGDVVVIGAGITTGEDLVETTGEQWEEMVATLRSVFVAVRSAAQSMIEREVAGRIVVLVPGHALRTSPGCGRAAIAGSFLATVSQVAALELGPSGIRVNAIAVGPLEGEAPPAVADAVPIGRLIRPADVARVCVLLSSDAADAVNGAVVPVDGGYVVTKVAGGSPFSRR